MLLNHVYVEREKKRRKNNNKNNNNNQYISYIILKLCL